EGVRYLSSVGAGVTASGGLFEYRAGDRVEFSIGDIQLGAALAGPVITPGDLEPVDGASAATMERSVNVARFLQTLDDDRDLSNGIQITPLMHDLAAGRTIDFSKSLSKFSDDGAVQILVADLTATRPTGPQMLVSPDRSLHHFGGTLNSLISELTRQMDELIGPATCAAASECDAIAVGHRACGGPGAYRAFSTSVTSAAELEAIASQHRQHSRALNIVNQVVSICSIVPKPAVDCVANRCLAQ
ncbi:MAG: hypothetical protein HKN70_11585, partial [Gammaproteobacteria bacterium]|nr:hypothetical protein [Gammaproteobacteria bacterium]